MIKEMKRLLEARKWMKKNEEFLPTWHAHVGYSLDLFDHFAKGAKVQEVQRKQELDEALLKRWVEVGLAIGHLKKKRNGKVKSHKEMTRYISRHSPYSVGVLLTEMMELHIPTLLSYKDAMKGKERVSYLEKDYGPIVAQTSSLLEALAFPKLMEVIKKNKASSILDMGCGYGGYLSRIYEKNPDLTLTGIELHEEIVKEAKEQTKQTNVEIIQGDIQDFYTKEYKSDIVMMNNLLYYFSMEERQDLFKNAKELLNKKGRLLIMAPLQNSKHGQAFSAAFNSFMSAHENLYPLPSEKEIKSYAKKSGLKVKKVSPIIKEGGWYLIEVAK
ncbi:bifunctional 2-polyprenyl-6-hydroxyphenol methylase/3-demethylubiquinol 3-O-methyltransferase UbiG [Thalassobacillus sp. C254]|uniref:class I SAM-dependent methyltransferase n=1 Tax=Thalassobacillus sp. C254 TaxID=1225341 RepID=UPI0006CF4CAD|nr:class I SAM-dependent methyltransferase [Thalassobacillus sp. C254]